MGTSRDPLRIFCDVERRTIAAKEDVSSPCLSFIRIATGTVELCQRMHKETNSEKPRPPGKCTRICVYLYNYTNMGFQIRRDD